MPPQTLPLLFHSSKKPFTLGAEIELQVIDLEKLTLTPRAPEVLYESGLPFLTSELFQSTLECVSPVCNRVEDVARVFVDLFKKLAHWGQTRGLAFTSAGTHALADYRDRLITPSPRYEKLLKKNQWLIRRRAVYGLHVHLGMSSGEMCIQYANFFLPFVPHFIALSASSPFWQRMDTGLIACRPTLFESLPTAGLPYQASNWADFEQLYHMLMRSGSIESAKDLSWDIRPSPHHGTLEIRVCDATSLRDSLTIIAFIHMLALWFKDHPNSLEENFGKFTPWVLRENKWRAIRSGLDAEILIGTQGETRSLSADLEAWAHRLSQLYDQHKCTAYRHELMRLIRTGNSAQRQKQVYAQEQNLAEVIRKNLSEFLDFDGLPITPSSVPVL